MEEKKIKEYIDNLKELWIKGKTEDCLNALIEFNKDLKLEGLQTRSQELATRFHNSKKEYNDGLITNENFNVKKNNLTKSFLSICKEIIKPPPPPPSEPDPIKKAIEALEIKDYDTARKLAKIVLEKDNYHSMAQFIFCVSLMDGLKATWLPKEIIKRIEARLRLVTQHTPDFNLAWALWGIICWDVYATIPRRRKPVGLSEKVKKHLDSIRFKDYEIDLLKHVKTTSGALKFINLKP